MRSVQIGGYSIAVSRAGAAKPTVVLESGCGNDHSTWSDLQRALSGHACVVCYDRPGAGQRDRPREARTIAAAARLLREVLDAVGAHRPAVLVGHSLGGVIAAEYARSYPADVHHLVLLDPTPAGFLCWVLQQVSGDSPEPAERRMHEEAGMFRSADGNPERLEGVLSEPLPDLGQLPLTVVTHGPGLLTARYPRLGGEIEDRWQAGQRAWADASARGRLITATGAGHYIHRDDPDLTLAVIREALPPAAKASR